MQNLPCKRIQCEEVWSFVYAKQKNVPEEHRDEFGYGDVWTWTALDADTKLVPSWLVGERNVEDATAFISDLASRLASRVQLTTDGHRPYLQAVENAFGADIDYAMLVKLYGSDPEPQKRYSPARITGTRKQTVAGDPDPAAVALHYMHYNYARPHKTLSKPYPTTPAMAAGITDHVWTLEEIVILLDTPSG
jgi:IS1 family transposase